MLKKILTVLAVTLLSIVYSISFAANNKPSAPIKVKGFYIGMDIEEAKNRLIELLGDKEIIVEEIAEAGEKLFFIKNVNRIKKEDLEKGGDAVWQGLIANGYINELGRFQKKLFMVEKPEQLDWNPGAIKDSNYAKIQVIIFNNLKPAGIRPKIYYEILAGSDKKVKSIYFSGGASDKLFNTEGVPPTNFAYNFVKAYLIEPSEYHWPEIDSQKVIKLWDYQVGCHIVIYSDKSFSMEKIIDVKDYKFD